MPSSGLLSSLMLPCVAKSSDSPGKSRNLCDLYEQSLSCQVLLQASKIILCRLNVHGPPGCHGHCRLLRTKTKEERCFIVTDLPWGREAQTLVPDWMQGKGRMKRWEGKEHKINFQRLSCYKKCCFTTVSAFLKGNFFGF